MDLIRGLSSGQLSSLRSFTFYPNLMVEVLWPGYPLRFHLGDTDLSYQGNTFAAFGPLATLALPPESQGLAADAGSLSIIGVSADLDGMLDSPSRGTPARVWMAFMNGVKGASRIGPPVPLFQGKLGGSRIKTSPMGDDLQTFHRIEVDLSVGPSARASSSIFHSNEDQKKRFPADTAGRLVIFARAKAQKTRWPA